MKRAREMKAEAIASAFKVGRQEPPFFVSL
jgi:hypothetical protein